MSEERPTEEQFDELRRKRDALDNARNEALQQYIASLADDEGDLAIDGDDVSDETEAEEVQAEIDKADELRVQLDDGDHDRPETGDNELVEKVARIAERLDAWEKSLRERDIDPKV